MSPELLSIDGPVITIVVAAATVAIAAFANFNIRRDARTTDQSLQRLQEAEQAIAGSLKEKDDTTFASLWAVTQQRIDAYHRIALRQSTQSFIGSQVAIYVGFIILVVLGIQAAQASTIAGAVTSGAIGATGGALSGFIAATFMKSHARASAQLQQFFLQPVEFTRLLGAERLIDTLPAEDRAAAILKIVESMTFTIDLTSTPPTD